MSWHTRFYLWRMDWFPYRVRRWVGDDAVWMRPRRLARYRGEKP